MTKITYIENTHPVTYQVEHAADLSIINHASIYCEATGDVGLNDKDWETWGKMNREPVALRLILVGCMRVDELYFRLMVSGDIDESFKNTQT